MSIATTSHFKKRPAKKTAAKGDNRTIRYAVVGLGHISQAAVLPAFAHTKNSELTALVSGDGTKLKALKKKYGVEKVYSYEEYSQCLADPEIDAVYIALPNDLHCEYALRAAAAGKHILCEKPLADTARDAELMTSVAKHHGVLLMTAYRLHFEPGTLASLELVRSGKIGEVRYFNSSFSYQLTDNENIRLDSARAGGPLLDIGIYCINACRMLFGDEPTEVSAFFSRDQDPRFREVEKSAAVILRFPRGKLGAFTISFDAASMSRAEVVGSKGSLVLEPAYEYEEGLKQVVTIDEKPETKKFPKTDQFAAEIEVFSNCIVNGREPEPSGEEGIADLRVIDAIFESAATGRAVSLPSFKRRRHADSNRALRKPPTTTPRIVKATAPHN
ncbi:MAG: Gfo/Idh/MocA family oxidoreductase [Nibricoccus sp.]